jgi:hypothetical protein
LVYRYAETASCSISLPIKTPEKVVAVCTTLRMIYFLTIFIKITRNSKEISENVR